MNTLEAIYSRRTIQNFNGESISETQLKEILKVAYASPVNPPNSKDLLRFLFWACEAK